MEIEFGPLQDSAVIDGVKYIKEEAVQALLKDHLEDSFLGIAEKWRHWSLHMFGRASKSSSLIKLQSEIEELLTAIECGAPEEIGFEYADCFMCLLHSAAAAGLSMEKLTWFLRRKMQINEERKWDFDRRTRTYSHKK